MKAAISVERQESSTVYGRAMAAERQRDEGEAEFFPDGYLVTDVAGTITEANHAATVLLNKGRDFLLGKPLIGFVAETERKTFFANLVRLTKVQTPQDWDVRMQRHGGTPFPAAITAAPIHDSAGHVVGLRWLVRDITERWLMEEALRESNDLLNKLIQHTSNAIFIINPERMKILDANPKACHMLECNRERLLSLPFSEICPSLIPELPVSTEPAAGQQADHKTGWRGRLTFVTRSGQPRPAEALTVSVDIAGTPCVIVMVDDGSGHAQADATAGDKVLRGLIPICAACKQIRDGAGTWHTLESYITNHSEAQFTHGLCPVCAEDFVVRGTADMQ